MDHTTGSTQSTLLTTKLYAPQARPFLVPRLRLRARIDQARKLTLVSAPAGSGKTTLVVAWMADGKKPVAWFSLSDEDNDPGSFWRYCIASLNTLYPMAGTTALTLLQSLSFPALETVVVSLINDLVPIEQDFFLVLDDYHLVQSPEIHRSVAFLLEHLPPRMHLVITSRVDPPLPLARLRGQGQLTEVRAQDLRFTPDEAIDFFKHVMGLDLSVDVVATLEQRTEGWAAGLQLAALSLQGQTNAAEFVKTFKGSDRYVLDYLVEEVLQRQPSPIQSFLLTTSILERLNGSLCDAVTGGGNGQAMLEALERANLFLVPLDNERHWYRYHHLFADLLRHRLVQSLAPNSASSPCVADLHRRAASWYEQHNMITSAILHTLLIDDYNWTAHLITRVAESMLTQGESMVVLTWLRRLPDTLIRSEPKLCLIYAMALLALSQFDEVETYLRDAEHGLALGSNVRDPQQMPAITDAEVRHLVGRIDAARSTVAINYDDYAQAILFSRRALALLSEEDRLARGLVALNLGDAEKHLAPSERAESALSEAIRLNGQNGLTVTAVTARASMAQLRLVQGRLHQAADLFKQAIELASSHVEQGGQILPSAGKAYVFLSEVCNEWNDLEMAASYAAKGIELCEQWGHFSHRIDGYLSLAGVQHAQGDIAAALATLQTALSLVDTARQTSDTGKQELHNHKFSNMSRYITTTQTRLWLLQGRIDRVVVWVREQDVPIDKLSSNYDAELKLMARFFIAQGEFDRAVQLLARLLTVLEAEGLARSMLEGLAIQSLALYAQGNTSKAVSTLARALSLAEPEGYIRTFVNEGAPMQSLLQQVASHRHVSHSCVSKLLQVFQHDAIAQPVAAADTTLLEPLSEREQEILRLLAMGMSNREIAASLVLTIGTIKWYVNSIYGKLNVHTRLQAVTRARELRLLS